MDNSKVLHHSTLISNHIFVKEMFYKMWWEHHKHFSFCTHSIVCETSIGLYKGQFFEDLPSCYLHACKVHGQFIVAHEALGTQVFNLCNVFHSDSLILGIYWNDGGASRSDGTNQAYWFWTQGWQPSPWVSYFDGPQLRSSCESINEMHTLAPF